MLGILPIARNIYIESATVPLTVPLTSRIIGDVPLSWMLLP